jgi:CBS domain-containing protein
MKVKEVMLKPVFISIDASKDELYKVIKKNPSTELFFVIDTDKRFLGQIHENDLFYMLMPNETYKTLGLSLAFDLEKKFFAETAGDVMRKHGPSCYETDDAWEIALKFLEIEESEMPVLNKKNEVVGLITQGVLLRKINIK